MTNAAPSAAAAPAGPPKEGEWDTWSHDALYLNVNGGARRPVAVRFIVVSTAPTLNVT